MSASMLLIVVGVILIFLSSVLPTIPAGEGRGVSLWNLGWGFVLAGALVVGK